MRNHYHTKKAIPIYYGWLHIIFSSDFDSSVKELSIKTEGRDLSKYGAFCAEGFDKDIKQYYIVMPFDIKHDLIAHEVVHIVNYIYAHVGIQLDRHNDEPQAYLTGWVTKQVYKARKKAQLLQSK